MARPRASTAVDCDICGKTIGRRADLARHLKTHAVNKLELMHACPYVGCTFKTLQRSNLRTHLNVHSRERPNRCPTEGCEFSCSDPGSLTRHRKELHGYDPKSTSIRPSTGSRKAARQQRKVYPYSRPSSDSPGNSSQSTSSSSSSPRPQLPQIPEQRPPSSVLVSDDHTEESVKNNSVAYRTELITRLPRVDESLLAPSPLPQTPSPLTGLLSTAGVPVVEHPQLPVQENRDLAAELDAQLASKLTPDEVCDAEFENFLSQFDDGHADAVPPSSLPAPAVHHPAAVPTRISLPSYELLATVNNTLVPSASLASYEVSHTIDAASYGQYGYPIEEVPFSTQISQPYSFIAPPMNIYPQPCFYSYAVATSGFPYLY